MPNFNDGDCSHLIVFSHINPTGTIDKSKSQALSPEVIADKTLFTQGVIDMSIETMFLSVIEHPHVRS